MEPISTAIIAGVGIATSLFGKKKQQKANQRIEEAQRASIAAQQAAEASRQQAMRLEARRKQRETLRAGFRARALANSAAVSQGAFSGSALQGGYGQAQGEVGSALTAQRENLQIGEQIFAANNAKFNADMRLASANSQRSSADALVSLGGTITQNAARIDRVGSTVFGYKVNA